VFTLVFHLEDDLPQLGQLNNLRVGGEGFGFPRHHRGGGQKGDNVDWFWHPAILRPASVADRTGCGIIVLGVPLLVLAVLYAVNLVSRVAFRTARHGFCCFSSALPDVTAACADTSVRSSSQAAPTSHGWTRRPSRSAPKMASRGGRRRGAGCLIRPYSRQYGIMSSILVDFVLMACAQCSSTNETEFTTEMMIHFPGAMVVAKPGVLACPKVVLCVDCGAARFTTSDADLRELREGIAPAA
jgi:hypothetical protein